MTSPRIAVVIGSTRPTRICAGIATWVRDAAAQDSPLRYELLDLADAGLPFLDEPLMAALGQYEHEHTRAWSRLVSSYDGFIFVFPQYNRGYPAVLKNALDFLYHEWRDKPASFLTYGNHGGNQAAAQFTTVLRGLHMQTVEGVEAVITEADVDDRWQLTDVDAVLRPTLDRVRAVDAQLVAALGDSTLGVTQSGAALSGDRSA